MRLGYGFIRMYKVSRRVLDGFAHFRAWGMSGESLTSRSNTQVERVSRIFRVLGLWGFRV